MTDQSPQPEFLAPHSVQAEEALLGAILINQEAILDVVGFLSPDDFFILRNSWVWEAMLRLHERGEAIDSLTIREELRMQGHLDSIGGPSYISYLINNTPTSLHAEVYGHIIERAAIRRRLLEAAGEIAHLANSQADDINQVIDQSESTLFAVTARRAKNDLMSLRRAIGDYFDRIEYLYEHQGEALGVPSGFNDVDKLLGGFQKSDLLILAARPGMGKTSLIMNFAVNAARVGNARVAVFSLEMSRDQLVQRLIASETGINSQTLRLGQLDSREWDLFVHATGTLGNLTIFIDDTPAITPLQMRGKCRRLYREHGLDLVIVDYLQLMSATSATTRSENRVQEVSAISRSLKEMARELNVPVIAASQLSRAVEQRADKRPVLSDLRESGCITGDTLITLANTGQRVPISQLCGQKGFTVWSLNLETYKLEPATVTNAFSTGIKPVFQLKTRLGRTIRATANHKFLTINGWKRLDQLTLEQAIALPCQIPVQSIFRIADEKPLLSSRGRPSQAVHTLESKEYLHLATSDVYWDQIESIELDGEEAVFDLTVPTHQNFVANNIIVHNSIEQDADVVMFIYRDEVYNEDTERPNQADVIIAKHRNGPIGTVALYFKKELTQFANLKQMDIDLSDY